MFVYPAHRYEYGGGPAFRVHESDYLIQRGSGIGAIFSNIFRKLIPLGAKLFNVGRKVAQSPVGQSVIKAAKKTAVDTGLDLAKDVLDGKPVKQATKARLKQAGSKLATNVQHELEQGGRKSRPSSKKTPRAKRAGKKGASKKKHKPKKKKPNKSKSSRKKKCKSKKTLSAKSARTLKKKKPKSPKCKKGRSRSYGKLKKHTLLLKKKQKAANSLVRSFLLP